MNTDRVIHELQTLPLPDARGARERTLVAARGAYADGARSDSHPRRPRRIAVALASVVVILAISLTPAGHAATGWVTQLVGLSHIPHHHPPRRHIGGRPTDPTSVGLTTPNPQIVIGKGKTPWGREYQVSVYRSPQGKYGTCFDLWSPRVGQPTAQRTGQCSSQVRHQVIGDFCIADSSGCGDAHHSARTWTSPAIAAVSHNVARLGVDQGEAQKPGPRGSGPAAAAQVQAPSWGAATGERGPLLRDSPSAISRALPGHRVRQEGPRPRPRAGWRRSGR